VDFDLTGEQRDFQKAVRQFAQEVVAPVAEEHDREERFPLEVVRRMGELGLFGLRVPEEYGGQDADLVTTGIAIEEVGRVHGVPRLPQLVGERPHSLGQPLHVVVQQDLGHPRSS